MTALTVVRDKKHGWTNCNVVLLSTEDNSKNYSKIKEYRTRTEVLDSTSWKQKTAANQCHVHSLAALLALAILAVS